MKYIFFDFIHNYGGAQRSSVELIERLKQLKKNVIVFDPVGSVEEFKNEIKKIDVPYYSLNLGDKATTMTLKRNLLAKIYSFIKLSFIINSELKKVVKKEDAYIWTNSIKSLSLLILFKKMSSVKVSYFIRGIDINEKINPIIRWMLNLRSVKQVFVQSDIIKEYLIKESIKVSKIVVIPNVIEKPILKNGKMNIEGFDRENFNILMVATIIRNKGYLEAIKSMAILKKKGIKFKFYLAGKDKDSLFLKELYRLIEEFELNSKIIFLGYIDTIPELISMMDVVILPSYSEGMPRSIMEAMIIGKPVVATKVGGIPEFVHHKSTGYLIEVKNEIELAEGLEYYFYNPKARKRISSNGEMFIMKHYNENVQFHILSEKLF